VLTQARQAKEITQATYLRELQKRGTLGDEVDIEAEIAETQAEGPDLAALMPTPIRAEQPQVEDEPDTEEEPEEPEA